MTASNAELVRRGYEAAIRGDLVTLREFLDPEVKWHGGDPTALGACRNRREALEVIAQAVAAGKVGELVDVVEVGERVVVIMCPPGAPGEPSTLTANVTTVRLGKAIEIVHYPTAEDALAAVGLGQ